MKVQTIHIPFDEVLLPARMLRTDRFSCLYEHGRLRYVTGSETEVACTIYFAVRNETWETASYTIENEIIEEKENGFFINYTSFHRFDEIIYRADIIIKAEHHSISFAVKGEALRSFKRNRIGICVHHPIKECSGKEVRVTKPDGTLYRAQFPQLISPHQPFKDIKEMECTVGENIQTHFLFEGDIFETEDQRNWSDSSYKTYSTPLDLPHPVQVIKGEKIEQKVILQITGEDKYKEPGVPTNEEKRLSFPQIGYGRKKGEPLSDEEIELLRQIPFDHYRVELFLNENGWEQELAEGAKEASKLQTKLQLVVFFTDDFNNQLSDFIKILEKFSSIIDSILALDATHKTTPVESIRTVYAEVKKIGAHLKVGYGTDHFFAELNRNRPAHVPFDFVSFSLNPQVHAWDTRSLIENLGSQPDLIQTARSFAGGKEIYVSPITFKIRAAVSGTNEHPPDYDPRQHRSFGALWTLSALKNLSGASALTFYEAKGYRGILNKATNTTNHSPLFQVLKTIKEFKPRWIIDSSPHQKPFSEPIVFEDEQGNRIQFVTDWERTYKEQDG